MERSVPELSLRHKCISGVATDFALRFSLNELAALKNLAWFQANCPDAEYRDGMSAVRLATRPCQLTKLMVKDCVAMLTAACAETGDFPKSVALAEKSENERLARYRAGKPAGEE